MKDQKENRIFDKKTVRTISTTALVMCLIFLLLILIAAGGAIYLRNGPGLVIIDSKVSDIPLQRAPAPVDNLLMLPLLETLDNLDYEITTEDKNTYTIQKDGKQFILNHEQLSLRESTDAPEVNYIGDIPNTSDFFLYREVDDIYLSVYIIGVIMEQIECDYEILGYGEWRIVEIKSRST